MYVRVTRKRIAFLAVLAALVTVSVGYASATVEAQERDPASLLALHRRLIHLRTEHIGPEQILVVANRLSNPVESTQPVRWEKGPSTPTAGYHPPNLILIVADDLGISGITVEGKGSGVGGGLVPTPHVDAIAYQGANFFHGYAANATCSPSRAASTSSRPSRR